MFFNIVSYTSKMNFSDLTKQMTYLIACAFLCGILPLFSNRADAHIPVMLIIYSATLKYFFVAYKEHKLKINKNIL